jgi:hypothetical protein
VATVLLHANDQGAVVDLPPVCMKCGAKAESHQTTCFSWAPQWIGWILALTIFVGLIFLPIAIIVRLVMTKRMWVDVPLCERHQNPWLLSRLTMWGGLAVQVLMVVLTIVLFAMQPGKPASPEPLSIIAFMATLFYFPVWAVVASIIAQRTIHASLIKRDTIRLVSVSRAFAEAVYDAEDDAYRLRPRPRPRSPGVTDIRQEEAE